MAQRGLMQVDALDAIDQIQAIIKRFPPPEGTPYSCRDWLLRGVFSRQPLDPSGTPFAIDPKTGAVRVGRSKLFPMPSEEVDTPVTETLPPSR